MAESISHGGIRLRRTLLQVAIAGKASIPQSFKSSLCYSHQTLTFYKKKKKIKQATEAVKIAYH
jgi:hypothetical protein